MIQGQLFQPVPTRPSRRQREAARRLRDCFTEEIRDHHRRYVEAAIVRIDVLASRGKPFTARDVRDLLRQDHVPPLADTRAIGNAFRAAVRRGLIRALGWQTSGEIINHDRLLRVWDAAR